MKYNTTPIKNVDANIFVGKFNGVDFSFEPGETRYLPTHVTNHLAKQLKIQIQDKNPEIDIIKMLSEMLGAEIMTKDPERPLTFKEEMDNHELEFKTWQEGQKKENLLKKEEAKEIGKEISDGSENPSPAEIGTGDPSPEETGNTGGEGKEEQYV